MAPLGPSDQVAVMENRPNRSIAGLARERLGERLGGMLGAAAGEVLDLLAAGDAGRHDERVRVRRLYRGGEAAVAELVRAVDEPSE